MNKYRTSEIAKIIGIHPNTVRLYEELELIPKPDRMPNGYRVFTDLHIEQFRLARLAFQVEVLQNGLRTKIVQMIKVSAAGDYDKALELTEGYRMWLRQEIANAEEAIDIVKRILDGRQEENVHTMKRKEVSEYLNISMDTLRNWEMNGYRVYTDDDIRRLKIIRSLRCANYSLEAILTMLGQVSKYPGIDIKRALDTPKEDTEIIAVCDKLVTSLTKAESNAEKMLDKLKEMKSKF